MFGAELAPTAQSTTVDPEFRQDVTHRLVAQLLHRRSPRVDAIVVEDTQWLDDASQALLNHLASVSQERGWAVVSSRRPTAGIDVGAREAGTQAAEASRLTLGPLDDAAVRTILIEACPRPLSAQELDQLVERAQGNPLFAIELAGVAARTGGPSEGLPDTIEELIVARIDRLGPRGRLAVRLASVLGRRFSSDDYAAFVHQTGHNAETDLTVLADIFELDDDGAVSFRQLLHREAAYASVPFGQRTRLHLQAGALLETAASDTDAIAALLSQHFELGGDRARCWSYSVQAAERAMAQYSPADAVSLYRRALDFPPRGLDADERARTFEGLGNALVQVGSLEEAHDLFGRARRLASDPEARLRLLNAQGMCRDRQGRFPEALRVFTRVLSEASVDAVEARCEALMGRASVHHRRGANRHCHTHAAEALELARRAGLRSQAGHARMLLHIAAEAMDYPDAIDHALAAVEDFQATGELSAEAEVRSNLGATAQLQGDLDLAVDRYREAYALKEQVGDLMGAALIQMNLAEVELDRGVTDGVDGPLQDALTTFDATGFQVGSAYTRGLLGRHALMADDSPGAAELLAGSAASFDELGAESYAAVMELFLAEALLAEGRLQEVAALVHRNQARLDRGDVFDYPDLARQRLESLATALG